MYQSKRHSRTVSNQLVSNVSPPTLSRPSSVVSNYSISSQPRASTPEPVLAPAASRYSDEISSSSKLDSVPLDGTPIPTKMNGFAHELSTAGAFPSQSASPRPATSLRQEVSRSKDTVPDQTPAPVLVQDKPSTLNGKAENDLEPIAGPSTVPISPPPAATPVQVARKSSSFRHVPLRSSNARSPLPSSPLRPTGSHSRNVSTSSIASRHFEQPVVHRSAQPRSRITSFTSIYSPAADDRPLPTIPASPHDSAHPDLATLTAQSHAPPPSAPFIPPRTHSLKAAPKPPPKPHTPSPAVTPVAPSPVASPAPSPIHTPQTSISTPIRVSAPYRPGFQPKGVYRPRTDEFTEARNVRRSVGRIERTKLERRLEKLTQLHFSAEPNQAAQSDRPAVANRRASSFFDLDLSDLRNIDASDLWRGVLQSQALQGNKGDVRGILYSLINPIVFSYVRCSCGTKDHALAGRCISVKMSTLFVSASNRSVSVAQSEFLQGFLSSADKP